MITRVLLLAAGGLLLTGLAACSGNEADEQQEPPRQSSAAAARPQADAGASSGAAPVGADEPSAAALAFRAECDARLADAEAKLEALEASEGPYTLATNLEDFNDLGIALYEGYAKSSLYFNAHPDAAVRDEGQRCEQSFDELNTRLSLSRPVYDAIAALDVGDEDEATRYFVKKTLRDFRRAGVDRDAETRERVAQLKEQILELGQTFAKNIAEDVRTIELDSVEDLAGLPQDYIDAHPPNEAGKILITTNYPDTFPLYRYAERDDVRQAMTVASMNRGYPANELVLKDLIAKRHELAQLLGYPHWAAYVTEDKMIGSERNAADFIDKVAQLAEPRAEAETALLLARLREEDSAADAVQIWQRSYVDNLVRQERFEVDSKKIREYFAYADVRDGMFALVSDLFGVQIVAWETEVWHESVQAFELKEGDQLIGRFYLDMHPRDGKFKHAAAFPIVPGIADRQVPVAALMCNFPGGDGSRGLMEHNQVETFLHEFGHLIHFLFAGDHRWVGNSGIAAEWDFAEAPSQMLEEWIWDKETLQSFAVNAQGEVIPDELIAKMNAAREFGRGVNTRQQMFYAAVSLNYYNRDPATFELLPLMQSLQVEYSPYEYVPGTHFYSNFGHLDGYSAIYYTYMWSQVIALDMFSRFEKEGIRNQATARDYRNKVLAAGGAKPAAAAVEDFLGRPYSFDAFAASLQLEPGDRLATAGR